MPSPSFRRPALVLCLIVVASFFASSSRAAETPKFKPQQLEHFEKKIRPLLAKHCYKCHAANSKKIKGGLRLDALSLAIEGGDTGPAIEPGDLDESLLIEAIRYTNKDMKMPPKYKLPAAEIKLLEDWITDGAPWTSGKIEAVAAKDNFDFGKRKSEHWVWRPIKVSTPPPAKIKDWPRSPIDNYILDKIVKAGLTPAAPADKRSLIRRVYFDLIGLPPTPEEVDAFLKDTSPVAFQKVVDHLLASPHFGERWARHWMDLVRYAESRGHEFDANTPNAHQYRDYLIRAFNADVPYDQFLTEHVAGDLIEKPRMHPTEGFNESIIGTGFWFMGEWVHSPVDIRQDEADRQDNMIDVYSRTFLGMSVACARCHDHKFDAIRQSDYYGISGYLESSGYRLARIDTLEHNRGVARQLAAARAKAQATVAAQLHEIRKPVLGSLAKYLLAARDVISGGKSLNKAAVGLDAKLVEAWITHLRAAQKDANDPLHLWARIAHDKKTSEQPEAMKALQKQFADLWQGRITSRDGAMKGVDVIVDYTRAKSRTQWYQDGFAWGLAPTRPGEMAFSGTPEKPVFDVLSYGAARRDLAFVGLGLSGGAKNDSGSSGRVMRAGQSIRTPTFTVKDGTVHLLVQGKGSIFASVASHQLIQGPLHGNVIFSWSGPANGPPKWVSNNRLARYVGLNAHLELTPTGNGNAAILAVAQGVKRPGMPIDIQPSALMAKRFGDAGLDSPAKFAARYQEVLTATSAQFAAGKIRESKHADDQAVLAQWLLKHDALLSAAKSPQRTKLVAISKAVMTDIQTEIGKIKKKSRLVMAMWDGSGVNQPIMLRGSYKKPGDDAPRGLIEAVTGANKKAIPHGSGRLELAHQMIAPTNPLTSRVMVNRIWHHLTGRGIVPSVDNFGVLGQKPSHPELLDYLADRFSREGWSVKKMIRAVVLSQTYRMASTPNPKAKEIDPGNVLLHRMRIRRLQGEVIRDAVLAVSGRLDRKLFGAPVPVYLTRFMQGRGRPGGGPLDGAGRRSVYTSVRRNFLSPMMLAFDMPQPFNAIGRRTVSNVPAQALILMNDPLVIQQAGHWAKRMLDKKDMTDEQRIDRIYRTAFGRSASKKETATALTFLDSQGDLYALPAEQRRKSVQTWTDLCHVIFNVKEFLFIN